MKWISRESGGGISMASQITLYTRNILETGTVTVTGEPDGGYPEARLYDRQISFFWIDTVTEAKVFEVDQGASDNYAVDMLAIEAHNFDGEDLQWQYSGTGAWGGEETDAVTDWSQSGNGQIIKEMGAEETERYWRLTLTSMDNPQCSEIFMSYGNVFTVLANPAPSAVDRANVDWDRSIGGTERSTKFGDIRRVRRYSMFLDATDLAAFQSAMAELDDYSKPFYIKDHAGNYFLCRLTAEPQEDYTNKDYTLVSIEVVEML